jgi:transcriptional regulator with XRE-family HTH domain
MGHMEGRVGHHALGHEKGRQTDKVALRRYVARTNMTLRQLAAESGVSYSLIRKALAGERNLSEVTAPKLAAVIGCNVDDFSWRPSEEGQAA